MGRTGGGGGLSSGGGHSTGHHSGGGHSMGGSHRSGGSSFGGGGFGGPGSGGPRPGGPRPGGPRPGGPGPGRDHRRPGGPMGGPVYHGPVGGTPVGGRGLGCGGVLILIFVFIIVVNIFGLMGAGESDVASTIQRQKIESGNAYINDCVVDELNWCQNTSKMSTELKEFWEETGVQPYIILRAYDANLTSHSEMENLTTSYYDEKISNENVFLLIYYDAASENEDGYWTYANGFQTGTVMDSEAVGIFWNYLDNYWNDLSYAVDDALVQTFVDTGNSIMTVSATAEDVAKTRIIVIGVVLVAILVVVLVDKKMKRDKEKAKEEAEKLKEQEKILNTPLKDMVDETVEDLTEKYTKDE